MSPSSKIIKEAHFRLKNGNLPLLAGAFAVLCSAVLLGFLIAVIISSLLSGFIPEDKQSTVDVVTMGISFILCVTPFLMGYVKLISNISKGEEASLSQLFFCFTEKKLLSCYGFSLPIIAKKAVALILLLLLYFAMASAVDHPYVFKNAPIIATTIKTFFGIFDVLVYIIYSLNYLPAYFIAVDNGFSDNKRCKNVSNMIMEDTKNQIFIIILKKLHLVLLTLLVVPAFYTIPVISECLAVSVKWLTYSAVNSQTQSHLGGDGL